MGKQFDFLVLVFIAVLSAVFVVTAAAAEGVYLRPISMAFDTSLSTSTDSLSLWIVNSGDTSVTVNGIRCAGTAFTVSDTAAIIGAKDSVNVWIRFSAGHNLTYRDLILIETAGPPNAMAVPVSGTKRYPEALYAPTQGLWGEPLRSALRTIMMQGHHALGYTIARDKMYGNIDSNDGKDSVECIYTGRKALFTTRTGATANNFNCEHTWPQSKFNSDDPMVSDINHLFSTDETANNKRSNYPFGAVTAAPQWTGGGSKLGAGYGGVIVFEPRDKHKGDCARAMFYFITRYSENYGGFWTGSPYQEAAFRDWNKRFPPTDRARTRNEGVQKYQGNRNPYIDHPELIDRIDSFNGTASPPADVVGVAAPRSVHFTAGEQDVRILVGNVGHAALSPSFIGTDDPIFSVQRPIGTIAPAGLDTLAVRCTSVVSGHYTGRLVVRWTGSGGNDSLVIALSADIGAALSVPTKPAIPQGVILRQNFPNPFNPSTTIRYSLPASEHVSLIVYDVLGRMIVELVNAVQPAGEYAVSFALTDARAVSGVYLYRIIAGTTTQTGRMILVQ